MSILNALFGKKEEISYKDLIKQGAVVLDVRSKEEFECGHIKGAINIPLDVLPTGIKKIGDKNKLIITCCLSGGRSSAAKHALTTLGYTNVYNGGGWNQLHTKLQ